MEASSADEARTMSHRPDAMAVLANGGIGVMRATYCGKGVVRCAGDRDKRWKRLGPLQETGASGGDRCERWRPLCSASDGLSGGDRCAKQAMAVVFRKRWLSGGDRSDSLAADTIESNVLLACYWGLAGRSGIANGCTYMSAG